MRKLVSTIRNNSTYAAVWFIVRMFLVGAAWISFGHIVSTSNDLGVTGWQVYTVPAFIDGIAILGLIGRGGHLGDKAKRYAPVLILPAGFLSLTANVYAGHTIGDRIYGALVVAGFMLVEWYTTTHQAPPAKTERESRKLTDEQKAQRAATRAYNAYQKMAPAARAKFRAQNGGVAPVKPVRVKI